MSDFIINVNKFSKYHVQSQKNTDNNKKLCFDPDILFFT